MLTLSSLVEKIKEEFLSAEGTELPDYVVSKTLKALDPSFESIEYRAGKLYKIIEINSPEIKL